MEFNEKLQQLRKEKEWTQEQLAEKLFVSRTAISKWENGKGYPNIDSLKRISALFSVSIDDLLSGEELISLAENENRTNMDKLFSLVYGTLDIMVLAFFFLPLYIRRDSDLIRAVNLFAGPDLSTFTWIIYLVMPALMAAMGIVQIIARHFSDQRWQSISRISSIALQAFCIVVFVATRQPYATTLLFLIFMIKVAFLLKNLSLSPLTR